MEGLQGARRAGASCLYTHMQDFLGMKTPSIIKCKTVKKKITFILNVFNEKRQKSNNNLRSRNFTKLKTKKLWGAPAPGKC